MEAGREEPRTLRPAFGRDVWHSRDPSPAGIRALHREAYSRHRRVRSPRAGRDARRRETKMAAPVLREPEVHPDRAQVRDRESSHQDLNAVGDETWTVNSPDTTFL